MTTHTAVPASLPVHVPAPTVDAHGRGVRLPAGADAKLFGGWGVRF